MADRGSGARRSDRLLDVVAWLLALGGVLVILYAGFLPVPPFSETPVPLVWQVYGLAALIGAVGVGLRRAWGRALAIAIVGGWLGLTVLRFADEVGRPSPTVGIIVDVAFAAATTVPILWVLARRWPARDRRG